MGTATQLSCPATRAYFAGLCKERRRINDRLQEPATRTGARQQKPAGERVTSEATYENVACPFCGIICDDIEVTRTGSELKVRKNGCARAVSGFERPLGDQTPRIDGKPVSLDEAIAAASDLIRASKLPLYGGLATDVDGARAAMSIADRTGGVVDHALSESQFRNFRVLQTSGWFMSTLTEARNRADLVIVVASDVAKLHPRFMKRIVAPSETMFDDPPAKRTVVFLGAGLDAAAASGARIGEVITLPCPIDQVNDVLAALRATIKGAPVAAETIAGVPRAAIADLAERCKKAAYGIMVWSPVALDFANADLTVHLISETVKDLNVTTRFAGLSLGGNEGGTSAAAVAGWQTGYPLRVSFASGAPEFDALRYSIDRMLSAGEGDLLVWVASIAPETVPPSAKLPTVVLGTPGLKLAAQPKVFIPVGTPGVDHTGRMVRVDNVVSLPLKNLGRSSLPRVADVLARIEAAL